MRFDNELEIGSNDQRKKQLPGDTFLVFARIKVSIAEISEFSAFSSALSAPLSFPIDLRSPSLSALFEIQTFLGAPSSAKRKIRFLMSISSVES